MAKSPIYGGLENSSTDYKLHVTTSLEISTLDISGFVAHFGGPERGCRQHRVARFPLNPSIRNRLVQRGRQPQGRDQGELRVTELDKYRVGFCLYLKCCYFVHHGFLILD